MKIVLDCFIVPLDLFPGMFGHNSNHPRLEMLNMLTHVTKTSAILLALVTTFIFSTIAVADSTVVAKVGNVPITDFELNRQLQKLIPLASSYHSGVSNEKVAELQEQALEELIEQAYMVQYAFDEEISVPKSDVDAMIDPVRARFDSDDAFIQALGSEGVDGLRASIFRHLLAKKALQVAVENRVSIDEAALKSDFEKNKHRYMRPRQFRASHILIKIRPEMTAEEKAEKEALVKSLYKKALDGEDFYDLAYYNSEDRTRMVGGDIGVFHLGQAQPEIEEVIVAMKVGEISKPIRTFYGYEIVKLTEDSPETQLTFDDMREKLIANERKSQYDSIKADWMADLKKAYKVERFKTQ